MKRLVILFAITIFYSSCFAQVNFFGSDTAEQECSYSSFDLGASNSGLSFGNSQRWDGIRFNFSDCGVEEINGINITLWKPGNLEGSRVNGIAFGLSPSAGTMQGISLGIAASIAEENIRGINIGGLAVVSGGNAEGINLGGLAAVSQKICGELI